jgi:hypothetical protein
MKAGGRKELSVAGGSFVAALGVWTPPAPTLPTLEWSRLAMVDANAQDEAAYAVSSTAWTLGMAGGRWEGKARSLQLPTACIFPASPQPPTDL